MSAKWLCDVCSAAQPVLTEPVPPGWGVMTNAHDRCNVPWCLCASCWQAPGPLAELRDPAAPNLSTTNPED